MNYLALPNRSGARRQVARRGAQSPTTRAHNSWLFVGRERGTCGFIALRRESVLLLA